MANYLLKCVGAWHRPPAKALINMCSAGTALTLRKEPTNPFDPNAIQVLLRSDLIPEDQFEEQAEALAGFGFDRDAILAEPEWHIGFIPAKDASWLVRKLPDEDVPATLEFDHEAKPLVKLTVAD